MYITEISKSDVKLPLDQAEATVRAMQATVNTKAAAPLIDYIISLLSNSKPTNETAKSIVQNKLDYYKTLKETLWNI